MPKSRSTKQEVADREKVVKILSANQNMNFVQRILAPQNWPVLQDAETGPSNYASHAMARELIGPEQTPMVFPTVIYDAESKRLKRLPLREAQAHAEKTGEFLAFNDPKEADWFASGGYKLGMGSGFVKP